MSDLLRLINTAIDIRNRQPCLNGYGRDLDALCQVDDSPFSLAVVGRMKAGKSTLINAIIGSPLAVSDVNEATATINRIVWGAPELTGQMLVAWKDGTNEMLPVAEIDRWTGKGEVVQGLASRTSSIQFHVNRDVLRKTQIIDTPGLGSTETFHDETIRAFLDGINRREQNRSDAIIYVIPPVARDNDAQVLTDFDQGRLPGMGPYNTVCVLHKWDALDGNPFELSRAMAERASIQLSGKVAEVFPVSGPLALTARHVHDDWFQQLQTVLRDTTDLERILIVDRRWDQDADRKRLRDEFPHVPWSSFKLVARVIKENPDMNPGDIRKCLLDHSGILALEDFLQKHFFAKSGIIRHLGHASKIKAAIDPLTLAMRNRLDEVKAADTICPNILSRLEPESPEWHWVKKHYGAERQEQISISEDLPRLTDLAQETVEDLKAREFDFSAVEWIDAYPDAFPSDLAMILKRCCAGETLSLPKEVKGEIASQLRVKANLATARKTRNILEHIGRRFDRLG